MFEKNEYFEFQFGRVYQSNQVFKIGTDAVLLAAWIEGINGNKVLEIGVGTGVISFILSRRFQNLKLHGIDSSIEAINLTEFNLKSNDIADFQLYHSSLEKFNTPQTFQTIVSNPPFFVNSLISIKKNNQDGKHTQSLSPFVLLKNIENLLDENGNCFLIYPYLLLEEIEEVLENISLKIIHICYVKPFETSNPNRVLIKLGKKNEPTLISNLTLYDSPNTPTPSYYILLKNILKKYENDSIQDMF